MAKSVPFQGFRREFSSEISSPRRQKEARRRQPRIGTSTPRSGDRQVAQSADGLVPQMGESPALPSKAIFAPGQDEEVWLNIEQANHGPLPATSMRSVFR